jgi:hypothetical protein
MMAEEGGAKTSLNLKETCDWLLRSKRSRWLPLAAPHGLVAALPSYRTLMIRNVAKWNWSRQVGGGRIWLSLCNQERRAAAKTIGSKSNAEGSGGTRTRLRRSAAVSTIPRAAMTVMTPTARTTKTQNGGSYP